MKRTKGLVKSNDNRIYVSWYDSKKRLIFSQAKRQKAIFKDHTIIQYALLVKSRLLTVKFIRDNSLFQPTPLTLIIDLVKRIFDGSDLEAQEALKTLDARYPLKNQWFLELKLDMRTQKIPRDLSLLSDVDLKSTIILIAPHIKQEVWVEKKNYDDLSI